MLISSFVCFDLLPCKASNIYPEYMLIPLFMRLVDVTGKEKLGELIVSKIIESLDAE